jgi:alpha-tubulin suppressor-like RCC1 family protein
VRRTTVILLATVALLGVVVQPSHAEQAGGTTTDLQRQGAWLAMGPGASTVCVVESAVLRCWGNGTLGRLGYGSQLSIGDDELPSTAGPVGFGGGRTATAVSVGSGHACAIVDDGTVRCWGTGSSGRLGYGNTANVGAGGVTQTVAAAGAVDLGGGRTATAISAGGLHTCAILDDGTVRCWGSNASGQLGYDDTTTVGDDELPSTAGPVDFGGGRTAVAISAGTSHTCAILDDGTVRCWGSNASGQLGYGTTANVGNGIGTDVADAGPVDLGAGRTATAISAGGLHTCAILDDGTVRCWGANASGQLGYGTTANVGDDELPTAAGPVDLGGGRTAVAISAGTSHTCAILDDGTVRCWGAGANGRLGYGSTDAVGDGVGLTVADAGPVDLGTDRTALAISAGLASTCARLDTGDVRCWGSDGNGRLGYGSPAEDIGDTEPPSAAGPVQTGGTPLVPPGAPTAVAATAGTGDASVSWTAPGSDGNSAITGYRVTVAPTTGVSGGATRTTGTGTTTLTFTGLSTGIAYTFTVRATNDLGSSRGGASGPVTLPTATAPPAIPPPTTTTTTVPPPRPSVRPSAPTRGGTATVDPDTGRLTFATGTDPTVALSDRSASWSADPAGRVTVTGTATYAGDARRVRLNAPVDGIAVAPDLGGYWLVAEDGGVFAYGSAPFYGSLGATRLGARIIGLAATPAGRGYWLVGADGGVHGFGDAHQHGDRAGKPLAAPVVGITPTTSGNGYWLLGADGGVFAYGDATFHGSTVPAGEQAVQLVPTPGGRGYWIVTDVGAVHAFGDAS